MVWGVGDLEFFFVFFRLSSGGFGCSFAFQTDMDSKIRKEKTVVRDVDIGP